MRDCTLNFSTCGRRKNIFETACKILRFYYAEGGSRFYPIQMPVAELIPYCGSNGLTIQADALMAEFLRHADYLAANGTDYPALEVNYEQSIVAPAADILLQAYKLTGVQSYLVSARKQLDVLELFNGIQPSYHLRRLRFVTGTATGSASASSTVTRFRIIERVDWAGPAGLGGA